MATPLFSPTNARPWLAEFDPRVKLLYVFAVSVAAAVARTLPELSWLCVATALAVAGLRLPPRGWGAVLGIIALTVWGTMLSQGFFFPGMKVLFTLVPPIGPNGESFRGIILTMEGLEYGAIQSLRFVATILAGLTVSLSTSPERMLAALARFRLPTTLGFMTTAALRFLPLLIEEAGEVRQARRLRGYRFRFWGRPGARLESYRAELGLIFPVIAAALRRAETLAESVTARGFDAHRPRTFYPPLVMRTWETIGTWLLVAAAAVMIVVRVSS